MPLLWLSVWKEELKDQRNAIEDTCLRRLSEIVPPGCRVTILADRARRSLQQGRFAAAVFADQER